MSAPETLAVELAPDLAVEWNPVAARLASGDSGRAWSLRGDVAWDRFESLRLVYGAAGEEVILLAAVRPAGAKGHDEDTIEALRVPATGPALRPDQALLSVERGDQGELRRLGIELWPREGAPLRVAADARGDTESGALSEGSARRASTPLEIRADGQSGPGRHDLLTRA